MTLLSEAVKSSLARAQKGQSGVSRGLRSWEGIDKVRMNLCRLHYVLLSLHLRVCLTLIDLVHKNHSEHEVWEAQVPKRKCRGNGCWGQELLMSWVP